MSLGPELADDLYKDDEMQTDSEVYKQIHDAYVFLEGHDQFGNDIHRSHQPIEQLLLESVSNDAIAAINTLGFVKHTVTDVKPVQVFSQRGGIYIKKRFASLFDPSIVSKSCSSARQDVLIAQLHDHRPGTIIEISHRHSSFTCNSQYLVNQKRWRALVLESNPRSFAARVQQNLPFVYMFGSVGPQHSIVRSTSQDAVLGTIDTTFPTFTIDQLARLVSFDSVDCLSIDQIDPEAILDNINLDALGTRFLDLWRPSDALLSRLDRSFKLVQRLGDNVVLERK